MKLLDSTFIIDLMRGKEPVRKYLSPTESYLTTQINMYEVIVGLFFENKPEKLAAVRELFEQIRVLPLDDTSIIKAAEINARCIKKGQLIDDCDCLIAGTALSNGITTVITRNKKHFERIEGLKIETY